MNLTDITQDERSKEHKNPILSHLYKVQTTMRQNETTEFRDARLSSRSMKETKNGVLSGGRT